MHERMQGRPALRRFVCASCYLALILDVPGLIRQTLHKPRTKIDPRTLGKSFHPRHPSSLSRLPPQEGAHNWDFAMWRACSRSNRGRGARARAQPREGSTNQDAQRTPPTPPASRQDFMHGDPSRPAKAHGEMRAGAPPPARARASPPRRREPDTTASEAPRRREPDGAPARPSSPTQEGLACPVCLEVLYNPVTLQCGHSACRHCFVQHLESISDRTIVQNGGAVCPSARCPIPFAVPQPNRTLQQVIEAGYPLRVAARRAELESPAASAGDSGDDRASAASALEAVQTQHLDQRIRFLHARAAAAGLSSLSFEDRRTVQRE